MQDMYAQALWQMLEEGANPKDAAAKLRVALKRQGRTGLLPKIARTFSRLAAREERKKVVTLSLARREDEHAVQKALKESLQEIGVSPEDVAVKLDESLVGGWRLEGRERLIDASFKKDLLSLYNRVLEKE